MPVEIYTDESVPMAVAAGLQRRHVAAISARDAGILGLTDEEQLAYAASLQMVIFTHDTDFLRLASA
jgi:predicted nuclease of predicted toxin-antitoxin system